MNAEGSESALGHVVAVMFENRSFDNLLGERESADEVGHGHDHALGPAVGHHEVALDGIRAAVDPRDHAR
ncbi:MAG TPA: hypothetical protein VLW50_11370 [Streptosporangiaceae bacterium]|nr:hypothetical protein [Streptosporangiaceae bacterium]